MQDIHHCGTGDSVWDIQQLAAGGDLLDWEVFWDFLREDKKDIEANIVLWAG